LLQAKAKLDAQKAHIHVPNIPERESWFGGHDLNFWSVVVCRS